MRSFYKALVLCVLSSAFIISCNKPATTNSSTLTLDLRPYFGPEQVITYGNYTRDPGNTAFTVSFTKLKYYVSNVKLTKTDGTVVNVNGQQLFDLSNPDMTTLYPIGNIPDGSYKSLSFDVGLDPTLNHIDPNTYSSNNVLSTAQNLMHFTGDSAGYIFLAAEGGYIQAGGNGVSYIIHIGTDPMLQTVNLPDHSAAPYNSAYTAKNGNTITIPIKADFSVMFGNLALDSTHQIFSTSTPVLADTLANRIPGMFSYVN